MFRGLVASESGPSEEVQAEQPGQRAKLGSGGGWCRQQGESWSGGQKQLFQGLRTGVMLREGALAWLSIPAPLLIAQGLFQTSSFSEYYPYFFLNLEVCFFSRCVSQHICNFLQKFSGFCERKAWREPRMDAE